MADDQHIARCRSLYAKLLALYPRSFRERFAEAMAQTFGDLCRERRSAARLFAFMLWAFAETCWGIIRENVMTPTPLHSLAVKASAWLPVAFSLAAVALLLGYVAVFGIGDMRQQHDENAAAHLFQLFMVAQTLIAIFFAIRWLPRAPLPAVVILVAQVLAAAVPMILLRYFEKGF
ncbi:MAG: hypothetical protein WAW96_03600 [Alphaproteobacteria bacterium]